jgi:molybdate transport system regulatory protein
LKKHAISLRITLAPDTLLRPGKADLLQGIKETGSIAAAGRRKKTWPLCGMRKAPARLPLRCSLRLASAIAASDILITRRKHRGAIHFD